MKKKVLCTVMAVTILLTQTASAAPWQMRRNQLIFDSEIEFLGSVTLQFASDGGKPTAHRTISITGNKKNFFFPDLVGNFFSFFA